MRILLPLSLVLPLLACSPAEEATGGGGPGTEASVEETLRLALENAKPGDVIEIPAGVHELSRSLTLNTDGVTIRGAGMNESVLSFRNQVAGAEGLLVNASDFTIEDVGIEDTVGDALKVNEGRNIVIRRVRAEWTGGPSTDNGAYGIYPVQTENTLIEESVAIGASDAGIYVGQSRNVVVRNSRAERNVAGIEIENTVNADVYGNVAVHNTGGVLVFNMPDLPQLGHSTRVFSNEIRDNNTANFGAPGSAVASVPAGSGVIINANDKVEIFDNRIGGHQTANVLISSAFSAEYSAERETAAAFDPYPETIYLYRNTFGDAGAAPDRDELDQLRRALFGDEGRLPDVVWDGVVRPEHADQPVLCIEGDEVTFINIDAGNDYQQPSTELTPHRCSLDKLAAVELALGA